jgi:prolyl-tRNA synthetase
MKTAITPTREQDYPEWYQSVLKVADLAEIAPVRGCMVIRPWGYGIWENIQKQLDVHLKRLGHKNAYFPLFIPLSYFQKEAEHVEGFAKECAVVTHHRLENQDGKLVPAGELEEPLIVRPTSEMMIGHVFSNWVQSYRDLPLLVNQWCNVVRWEMRTRMFLRTTEFLWQEGHTVHATKEEAEEEAELIHQLYVDFARDVLAIPFIKGVKTPSERFPGALETYTIEAMMQDKKALQGGTSHFLGQNFSRSCNITFQPKEGPKEFGWTTSWGVTTRLIGALVMIHSDDDGLVLPPRVAPSQIVLVPILKNKPTDEEVQRFCISLKEKLSQVSYHGNLLSVELDGRDLTSSEKNWDWIKKGIPMRVMIGENDLNSNTIQVARRDKAPKDKISISPEEFALKIGSMLDEMQANLLKKAIAFRDANTLKIDSKKEFYEFFTPKNSEKPEIHGGFALCHWSGDAEVEEIVKKDLNVTIRCIPLDQEEEEGVCVISGKPSRRRVIFAKAY